MGPLHSYLRSHESLEANDHTTTHVSIDKCMYPQLGMIPAGVEGTVECAPALSPGRMRVEWNAISQVLLFSPSAMHGVGE